MQPIHDVGKVRPAEVHQRDASMLVCPADVRWRIVADYVPVFFPNADLSRTANIAKYMQRCAARPAFAQAFGDQHAALVQAKTTAWLESPSAAAGAGAFWNKLGL